MGNNGTLDGSAHMTSPSFSLPIPGSFDALQPYASCKKKSEVNFEGNYETHGSQWEKDRTAWISKAQSPWRIVSLSPTRWIFSKETSQTRNRQKITHQMFLKKHQIPSTVSTRPGIAQIGQSPGQVRLGIAPTTNWKLSPWAPFFSLTLSFCLLCLLFFVQIQLASPVRISHLKGGTVGSDFSWRSWTHCHLLWPLTGSLTADICKIHIHVYI